MRRLVHKLPKLRFRNPPKKNVIIFDEGGCEVLERMVIHGIDHFVLHTRFERIYITPHIVLRMIGNVGRIRWTYLKQTKKDRLRKFLSEVYLLYLFCCIKHVNPKVVLTFVDNSYLFQSLSRSYRNAAFYAVQNGIRYPYNVSKWLPESPHPGSIISMPALCCFGEYERDLYEKHGHQIDKCYSIGSIRGSYYRAHLAKDKYEKHFDVCLVSEWSENIMTGNILPEIRKALDTLYTHVRRFYANNNFTLCIATRSRDEAELSYFRNLFDGKVYLTAFDQAKMTTYEAMDMSTVIVSFCSTAALEAFGWGKKVLFCNFSGDSNYDSPRDGIWSLKHDDFDEFSARLHELIRMDESRFQSEASDHVKYLMNYSSNYTSHEFVRKLILNSLM